MTLIKVSIKWQKRTDGFWQLIETSNNGILGFLKLWSAAKIRQFFFGSWSNFSINWKASKNLVNWLWKFRSTDKTQFWSTDFWSSDHSPLRLQLDLINLNNLDKNLDAVWSRFKSLNFKNLDQYKKGVTTVKTTKLTKTISIY